MNELSDLIILEEKPENEQSPQSDIEQEKISFGDFVVGKIQKTENKSAELIENGQKSLKDIEQKIGLSTKETEKNRDESGILIKLEKIEEKAIDLFANFRESMANYLSIGDEKINNQEISNEETRPIYFETEKKIEDNQYSFEMKLVGHDKNNEFQLDKIRECMEALEKNEELTMSKDEFNTHCSPEQGELGSKLRQSSVVGDCYLVSALHAISCTPFFEMFCRTSMKINKDGSWEVKIPFMNKENKSVTIAPNELMPQKNEQFLNIKSGNPADMLRPRLNPLAGKDGLKVLEAAYMKSQFGKVDRMKAEGGGAGHVFEILGGTNFIRENERIETKNDLEEILKENSYSKNYLLCGGASDSSNRFGFSRIDGTTKILMNQHEYSVAGIDWRKKTLQIVNPWNTSLLKTEVTFNQFEKLFAGKNDEYKFSNWSVYKINSEKILKNILPAEKPNLRVMY